MPLTMVIAALVAASTLYYAWFILRARHGLRPAEVSGTVHDSPRVSVVVAARNEEADLPECLGALAAQDYPGSSVEFIIVDDGSTDATASIVQKLMQQDPRFRLLRLEKQTTHQPSRKRGRKPEALAAGIDHATGDIIAITDADCRPVSTWIRSLTTRLSDGVVYAVGPVVEQHRGTFFSALRSLEILGLTGMAGGRIGIGRPLNSLGGNLAFRKEAYRKTGGFDYHKVKSDEETMMHRILQDRIGRVAFVADRTARVTTTSPATLRGFWNQRKRWGSMHGRFDDKTILVELSFLYVSLLLPAWALCGLLFFPGLWPWVAGFFLVKTFVDWRMLRTCSRLFGEPFSPAVFVVAETFHTFYIIIVSAFAQFSRYTWKDRTVLTIETAGSGS